MVEWNKIGMGSEASTVKLSKLIGLRRKSFMFHQSTPTAQLFLFYVEH